MSDAVEILVTHVDSPSNFFFKYAADNERIICKKEIRRIDNEIRRLVGEKKTCDPCIPAINSVSLSSSFSHILQAFNFTGFFPTFSQ